MVCGGPENALTRKVLFGLQDVKYFPEKKAEQDKILVMAKLVPRRPNRLDIQIVKSANVMLP